MGAEKVLVTGATGFLGSELVRQLLAQGQSVRVLARKSAKFDLLNEVAGQFEIATGDVTDPLSVRDALKDIQTVYHAAAFVSFGGQKDAEKLREVNVLGTANVVNSALDQRVKRLVLTSSMAAFGRPANQSEEITEDLLWMPSKLNTRYALSKYDAELEVYRGIAEGLDAVIVNPALIFGIGRLGEGTMKIVHQVKSGKLPAVPWGATNVVDVRDVAAGHLLARQHGKTGERYFLGGENLMWNEIVAHLATAFGVKAPTRRLHPTLSLIAATITETIGTLTGTQPLLTRESARASIGTYRYSTQKAETALGYLARPFAETAAFLAENWPPKP
ncbi:MAG: SDR family NAD(P)-dependent oxidoreductase [Bacteroidetes Order II. Incertae sedis bacterium]|nr:SDR family NAD(P)-dependent oxidoreductase [Bacteroidetes Order II. bacterium]